MGAWQGQARRRGLRVCCIFLDLRVIDLPLLDTDSIYAQR